MVAQLHRTLIDAMRRSRPASLHRPVTVAEIYQDLVPYKTARSEIGFDLNADYEHTLLRLLAGEGDFARIEPREVRDKLRLELESPNPDVGLFRNYAACDVWVNVQGSDVDDVDIEEIEDAASWEQELVQADPAASAEAIAAALDGDYEEPIIEFVAEEEADIEEIAPIRFRAPTPFEIATEEGGTEKPVRPLAPRHAPPDLMEASNCVFCGGDLPAGRMVNFCPFCGSDQSQQPCPSCGELLEPLWRFCVACGVRVRPLGDHVN